MTYYPEFARLLNQELQRQDRSASWLAQRLDVSPSTVTRWLNHGTRPGTPEMVARIADGLGITSQLQTLLTAAGYGFRSEEDRSGPIRSGEVHVQIPPLPRPSTPMVGRAEEIAKLSSWLADATQQVVTIVGPGGMGKTRLALAVAQAPEIDDRFRESIAFADLAPLSDVGQMPAEIAHAIGMPLESGGEQSRTPEQQIVDFLSSRQLMLIVDNAEHLLAGAPLIADIARAAPKVQILVTSRAPLNLPGEQLYPLRGLDYVDKQSDARLTRSAATALFLQSAQRIKPDYSNDSNELRDVVEICTLVQGMPLAIELAAPWIAIMSAADILAEIRRSLDILETDSTNVPERHRSMEAVFDATWQRLDAGAQQVFAQISIFRGGFTRDAVTHVAGADLRQLRGLAARSLIVHDPERNRYAIHELLRQYGALRLAQSSDLEAAAAEAHSVFYIEMLRRRQNALKNRALQTDLIVLDEDAENLSKAWQWATTHDRVDGIVETLDGLGLYLQWRGRAEEGEAAFKTAAAALERIGKPRYLARALVWQAVFARNLGQSGQAAGLLQRSRLILDDRALAEKDIRSERAFLLLQSGAAEAAHDTDTAQRSYLQSLGLFEELNEAWYVAEALLGLGHISLTQGDFDGQRAYVQRALDMYRTLGNVRGTASALSMLADIDSYRGRLMSGLELGYESLAAFRSLGDPAGSAICLSRIGMTYMNLGDVNNARLVVNESAAIFEEIGSRRDEVIAYAYLTAIELMAGDYVQAHSNALRSYTTATDLNDQLLVGVALSFLGFVQIFTEDPVEAMESLRAATIVAKQSGATMEQTRAYALLGFVLWQDGQAQQARTHCAQSLRLCAQVADTWSLLTSISSTIVILADGDDPERAVELYSMLMQDPLCAASRWFEDGISPHVNAAMARLPDEMVGAALARGESLEQAEEAAKLVDEVCALGWDA